MMAGTDLSELVKRLERAQEPDRELDAEIAAALNFDVPKIRPDEEDLAYATMPHKDDMVKPGYYWVHSRSGASLRKAPGFTNSVDAALLLWHEQEDAISIFPEDRMNGWPLVSFGLRDGAKLFHHRTLALALCQAAVWRKNRFGD